MSQLYMTELCITYEIYWKGIEIFNSLLYECQRNKTTAVKSGGKQGRAPKWDLPFNNIYPMKAPPNPRRKSLYAGKM